MADVYLPSMHKNIRNLGNSMNSIASSISPPLPAQGFNHILNSNPEYIFQAESGARQLFAPNISFPPELPPLYLQTGYESNDARVENAMMRELIGRLGIGEFSNGLTSLASHSTDYGCKLQEEHEWRTADACSNVPFSLDLSQKYLSQPVTSLEESACLQGISSDLGYAESQNRFHSLCRGTSAQFEQGRLASSKSASLIIVTESIPASTTVQSRETIVQNTCQREEESPLHSGSSLQNAVQSPCTPVKAGISDKKRKDAGSPTTCAEYKIVKKAKTEDIKAKQPKSPENIKQAEEARKKAEANSIGTSDCTHSKDPEPPKQDFIHVRARRGQATDSHSLAERARREKISERMKFLQDLVPGCSKVSGKAVMLEEIINYVKSLQDQVELLSMKLASLSTTANLSLDGVFSDKVLQRHMTNSSLFGFNHQLISNISLPTCTPEQMNEFMGSRCTGGLDLRSLMSNQVIQTRRSNADIANTSVFIGSNSQTPGLWEEEVRKNMEIGV